MSDDPRERARRRFLAGAGWGGARLEPLPPDASFRRYYRLRRGSDRALLMDAPPGREDVRPYLLVAAHLRRLGICAPAVHAADTHRGLVLLQDFGDDTFTRLLAGGADETSLYEEALDVLVRLHTDPRAASVAAPRYDAGHLVDEALLLADWFYPALRGAPPPPGVRKHYAALWRGIVDALPPVPDTLVLLDYHVDNLMRVATPEGEQCGVLDFQDARIGPAAYDVMSLLEDARRDVSPELAARLRARYADATGGADPAFAAWFGVLAAQRHCKVAGIFVRLCHRDGKCGYLGHVPRVVAMLERRLREPRLAELAAWLDAHLPDRRRRAPTPHPSPGHDARVDGGEPPC